MLGIYTMITATEAGVQERLADLLESKNAEPGQRAMLELYLSDITFPPGAKVLEVGCGTGAVTRMLARWPGVSEAVGLDLSSVFLRKARMLAAGIHNLLFIEGDAQDLPFEEASFDVGVFNTSLSHILRPECALAEASRVIRPGGWLAIFDGDYATPTFKTGDNDPLQACAEAWIATFVQNPWLIRRLPGFVRSAGFEIVSVRSHGYVEMLTPSYLLTIVDRGADALQASGRIGDELATALKAEARRRAKVGDFFGHIAYASLIARRTSTISGHLGILQPEVRG